MAQGETRDSLTNVLEVTSARGSISEGQADLFPTATLVQGTAAPSATKHGMHVAAALSTCRGPHLQADAPR